MPQGYAGNQRIVDIPANGGAFLPILAQSPCRRVVIEESPISSAGVTNPLQGNLKYRLPNDGTANGFTTVFEVYGAVDAAVSTASQVIPARIELGNPIAQHEAFGELLGNGPGYVAGIGTTPATTLIQIKSGGSATSVVVTEYN